MKMNRIFTYAALAGLCLAFLGGCGSKKDDTVVDKPSYWDSQQFDSFSGTDFVKVAESGKMELLLNPSTGTVRWLDTSTGIYQDSNMSHDESGISLSDMEQSDLLVRYFAGSKTANAIYNSVNTYDSYSMCSSREQLSYQKIDNGVRVLYSLGSDEVTFKNFPRSITDERMQEFVLQYLSDSQRRTLESSFYTQMSDGTWIRGFNDILGALATQQIYDFFYVTGHYTEEELYADLEAAEVPASDYPSNLMIKIPVDYVLDGEELVVSVDTTLMESGEDNPINQLVLLPYFLTSDPAQADEEGYMFVPDNSGALIYLDSTKTKEYHYAGSFYTGDKLVNASSFSSVRNKLMLPVFGMKSSTSTIFGIIEKGAEVASIDAYVQGTDNSEPFAKMRLSFDIQTQQIISSGAKNASGEYTMYKVSDDIYDDLISIRYFWLGADAEYLDMANCYSSYLEEQGMLKKEAVEDTAPFYVELMGSTDKTKYALGIPYEGTQILTSFDQAEEILQDLTDNGIQNIKLVYSGMVNGGMNQRSLSSGIKFVSGMGGKSGFKSLKSYADSIGAQIFPNLKLQTVNTKTNLSNDLSAWSIINERGRVYTFDPVMNTANSLEDEDYPLYLINPYSLEKYLNKVKKSYSSKIGLDTMATSDLYTFVLTNYRETHASPSTGRELMQSAVAGLADGMQLMLSNPISEAYAYSTYLTDIPTTDSGMRVLDASIPFMGMVLDGYKTYSSESLNKESTDVYVNFMRVLESNGVPKFTFMYEDSYLLSGTEQESYFAVDYKYWKDKISAYYEEYKQFYNTVKGATITGHELYERNDKLRVVTYSNGVKVYFNYSDLEEKIDGVTVPAFSYVVK